MFCKKCGNQIEDDYKFCNKCGSPISLNVESNTDFKNELTYGNKNIKQIANHLEFLGYKIEHSKSKTERDTVFATHDDKNNFIILDIFDDYIFFFVNLKTEKKEQTDIMSSIINEVNKTTSISKCFIEFDNKDKFVILKFQSVYIGEYSKERFSKFMDLMDSDIKSVYNVDGFNDNFLNT